MKTLLHIIVFISFIGFSFAGSAFNDAFELNKEGESYALKGQLNLAIDAYETALERDPSYGTPYINLVKTYYQLEDFHRVIERAENALKIFPHATDLHFYLGQAYLSSGNTEKGNAMMEKFTTPDTKIQHLLIEEDIEYLTGSIKDYETLKMSKK